MAKRLVLNLLKDQNFIGNGPVTKNTESIIHIPNTLSNITLSESQSHGNIMIKPNHRLLNLLSKETHINQRLKGVQSSIKSYQQLSRIYSDKLQVYKCNFFQLSFYPTEHFIGMVRKSKPSIHFTYGKGILLNGNINDKVSFEKNMEIIEDKQFNVNISKMNKFLQAHGSLMPRNWSYLRTTTRKFIRRIFINQWISLNGDKALCNNVKSQKSNVFLDIQGRTLPGVAKDGLYHYHIIIFPTEATKYDYERDVKKSIEAVANLSWDSYLHTKKGISNWVNASNEKAKLSKMNSIFKKDQLPFKFKWENIE